VTRAWILVGACAIASAARALVPGILADGRIPVPTAEQLAQSRRLLDAIYKDEMSAPTRSAQVELARKLLERSRAPDTDVPTRFVLLTLARDTATAADDEPTAFVAIEETTRTFQVDEAATKVDFIAPRLAKVASSERLWRYADFLLRGLPRLFEVDEPATAERLIAAAEGVAQKANDPDLTVRVSQARVRFAQLQADRDAYAAARAMLGQKPADPGANFVAGYHLAVLLGKWDAGLKLLVLGDRPEFAAAAALELKAPADAPTRVQLADRWSEVAAKQPPFMQAAVRMHAASWYRRAWFDLKDADAVRVAKRLAEIDPPPAQPKSTLKFDPADWRLYRRPTADWQPFPLDASICRSKGEVLSVRNPGDPQGHAKLAYMPRLFDGDFTLWCKYRGQIHLISFGEFGPNSILYFDKVPCERSSWTSFVMRRTSDGIVAWIDGLPAKVTFYNCDDFLPGQFLVELSNGQEIDLRDFAFRGGTPR